MATAPRRGTPRKIEYPTGDGKPTPDVIIELTSKSKKREDITIKWELYRDVLKVGEFYLFDPTEDYLYPPFQGHRLIGGEYARIEPVSGRLPSEILHLHLEREGTQLRLHDPVTQSRLLTRSEKIQLAEQRALTAEAARQEISAEYERLRQEVEALRRRSNGD